MPFMSTNYYSKKTCAHCGHDDTLHIGKSATGWCFSLRVYPDRGIASLDDWRPIFSDTGRVIEDEYGCSVSVAEMLKEITERSGFGKGWTSSTSQVGPNGLLRSRVDGRHCIGHGPTWDLIAGEFH